MRPSRGQGQGQGGAGRGPGGREVCAGPCVSAPGSPAQGPGGQVLGRPDAAAGRRVWLLVSRAACGGAWRAACGGCAGRAGASPP